MNWSVEHLWLIPLLPLLAAAAISVTSRPHRGFAAAMTIRGLMAISFFALPLWRFAPDVGGSPLASGPLASPSA